MLKRSLESLVAGICVYAAMAACAGGGASDSTGRSGEAGGPVALEGGQPSMGGAPPQPDAAGMASAGSPVPNAMAAGGGEGECGCAPIEPKEPTIVEAECETGASGTPSLFAVAEFPGKTTAELARVVALVEYADGIQKWPSGFVTQVGSPIIQDGSVAVGCGSTSAPGANAVRVRFVLP
jgi:hypothetical protein